MQSGLSRTTVWRFGNGWASEPGYDTIQRLDRLAERRGVELPPAPRRGGGDGSSSTSANGG
ncbi:MAG TPA: hypothetical protein VGX71_19125 [Pseudaminobacter sp.]|nr:hypothetical protein [Pseudaminobacter sp.]